MPSYSTSIRIMLAATVLTLTFAAAVAQVEPSGQVEPIDRVDQSEQESPALPNNTSPILLNFKDASVDTVLEYFSERAGLVVVKAVQVDGKITMFSRQPVSIDEAIVVLNSVLKEKGYAAILMGRTLKIVEFSAASKQSVPVHMGADPHRIRQTDQMITQVIPIRHADAAALVDNLKALIPSYAELSANVRSNSLILTDTEANVHRIVRIIQALDGNIAAAADVRVFKLEYADARNAAQLINDLFQSEEQRRGRNTDPRQLFFQAMGGGRRGGGGEENPQQPGTPSVPVHASADERTNTVVVTGPPDTLDVIQTVMKELDANPDAAQAVFIYKVRNGTAEDLAGVLNSLFQSPQSSGGGNQSNRDTSGNRGRFGGRNPGQGAAGSNDNANTNDANMIGEVDIVAEKGTNSLLIMTASKNFDRVRQIIEDLDRPVPQVLIKVLIAEVTHDDDLELGVDWTLLKDLKSFDLFTDLGVRSATGGLIFRATKSDLDITLRALEQVGKIDVLSRPYILVSENQEASITVGQRVPFIRRSRVSDTGLVSNDIEYEDIGIILTVTPHINAEGLVVMNVAPEISAITDSTVQISDNINATVFSKRAANSHVAVQDGQTIVIGGLMQDQLSETVKKVPLLGDIPLLGELFKNTSKKKTKTELLIFLTPHVANNSEELESISDQERAGTKIVPKAVAPGVYEDHMQGLQRGNLGEQNPGAENQKSEVGGQQSEGKEGGGR